ncbi:MAG: 4-hydroxy-3-methylbut-2-enyl diphosphate reductase [Opitutia bacterium Tous-C10FEB]|nr:MAG: 4-hydroxy-3-methylbut-2-enyl diphosphate reductase [Opitutae bacterium Tous-C10FEB]
MIAPPSAANALCVLLAFDASNRLAVRRAGTKFGHAFVGPDEIMAQARLASCFATALPPVQFFTAATNGLSYRIFFTQVVGAPLDVEVEYHTLDQLADNRATLAPSLAAVLDQLGPHLIAVPYLHLGEDDFIYRFRAERDRNRDIYQQDPAARALYQSGLCEAIKALARTNERSASQPATLDFGAVSYVIPSHFGFCLGVKNAIERAYETLAENPIKRVFMLSELIHNSFVNDDLRRRGLRFLQTDKGQPYTTDGKIAVAGHTAPLLWATLTSEDIVIIPAFGATDEDKKKLVRKGIRVAQYDATCMLVEKVWKAARTFGREGYTVVIHGKSEHEETKATFSNTRRHAPSIILRNLAEAEVLGDYITAPSREKCAALLSRFAGLHTPDFDPDRHLDRLAVVNQTTLLMNETSAIIDYFKNLFVKKYGESEGPTHVGGAGKKDTLCYATQVNQDALQRALSEPLDAAFIVGGKNSSNTYQLYRLCEQKLGNRAFFIQSEANIQSRDSVEHYVFSAATSQGAHTELHPLWPGDDTPKRVLITGGASCPDGLVQQVITRINSFFPPQRLRSVEAVITGLTSPTG